VFGAPTGDFMSLVCFRNGSLARERVRDAFGLDWEGFSQALRDTPPGNRGALMLPWFEPEITPPITRARPRTQGLDLANAAASVRACVEGQMLAMRRHSAWAAPAVERIHATGGAARNSELLQVMADVFEAPVVRIDVANAACLGAALRAAHADFAAEGIATDWETVVAGFTDPVGAVGPRPEASAVYRDMAKRHAELEKRALGGALALS
jgi:xylulokinase